MIQLWGNTIYLYLFILFIFIDIFILVFIYIYCFIINDLFFIHFPRRRRRPGAKNQSNQSTQYSQSRHLTHSQASSSREARIPPWLALRLIDSIQLFESIKVNGMNRMNVRI